MTDAIEARDGTIGAWIAQAQAELVRIPGAGSEMPAFEAWAAVRDRWRELGHRYDEAYAEVRWSEAKLAAGSRREADTALRHAALIAEELGAAPLGKLVADVSLRAGLDSLPNVADDGLTPREREILDWVARGASNRDIAEALFLSPKSVSVHISALLRMFGVSGRGDLRSAQRQR